MSVVINISTAVDKRNAVIFEKVSKLVFIHTEINNLELNLSRLQEEFKAAFKQRLYPEMLSISRNIYDFSIKLDEYRKLEQLVLQNK